MEEKLKKLQSDSRFLEREVRNRFNLAGRKTLYLFSRMKTESGQIFQVQGDLRWLFLIVTNTNYFVYDLTSISSIPADASTDSRYFKLVIPDNFQQQYIHRQSLLEKIQDVKVYFC